MEVRNLAEPGAVWRAVEMEIVNKEKEEASKKLMNDYSKETQMMGNMKEFVVTRIFYKETRYRVVYVPVYIIKYRSDINYLVEQEMEAATKQRDNLHNSKGRARPVSLPPPQARRKSKSQKYTFVVNGQTGKHDGIRPYGMGKVLGKGMRFLEGIFGVKDQEDAAFVTGKYLQAMDACEYYDDAQHYLLFPPSHSYILTSDIGHITLKNISERRGLLLHSHKRETDKIGGQFTLPPGATQTFDYKGSWCIRVEEVAGAKDVGPFVPDACLSVVEVKPDGGGSYGNLLGMM